jgi:hypothetical protein
VDHLDGDGFLTDGGGHALHRAVPPIARGKDARHARLQQQGLTVCIPPFGGILREVPAREDVAALVAFDLFWHPTGVGPGADEDEQGRRSNGLARELHDSVSQALYGIALGARTARELLDQNPERVADPLNYVLYLAEADLTEMRALIFELRPERGA